MENLTTDALCPKYHIWDQFVPKTLIEALKLDALSSSHPIEVSFIRLSPHFGYMYYVVHKRYFTVSGRFQLVIPLRWTRYLTRYPTTKVSECIEIQQYRQAHCSKQC
jgi:hypothetical protein